MFNFLKKKKKAKKDIFEQGDINLTNINTLEEHQFLTALLFKNDIVDIIYPACASCYGISEDKNKTYEQRLSYIGRRVKAKHTSILEHSNIIIQVFIPLQNTEDLYESVMEINPHIKPELCDVSDSEQDIMSMISEVRDKCRYLNIVTDIIKSPTDESSILRMTIGGSVRGYRYIFETIENRKNKLFISIFNVLKLVVPEEFFIDFINDEVIENYNTIEFTKDLNENVLLNVFNNTTNDMIDVINADSLSRISELLQLPKEKCFDFITITVDFKNMSRIITQQVTRHRNAITQESQRYVDYSKSVFNSPDKFKDKYEDKKYSTPLGEYTLQELGDVLCTVYPQLVKQGVDKEDARGYLPQNIQCGKLFITFTLRTLFSFINLRTDPHAQAEIFDYALKLSSLMKVIYAGDLNTDNFIMTAGKYSDPVYLNKNKDNDSYYTEIDEEV